MPPVDLEGNGYHNRPRQLDCAVTASSSERRCIMVAGFSRSGTSWLARCLSFAPRITYHRERDNYNCVAEAEKRFICAVKLVFAGLNMAAWFSANVPHAHQIYVLRDPCGQIREKRLG
jgi:hypothetical protein